MTDKALGLSLDERLVALFDEATLNAHDEPERAVGDESCNMSESALSKLTLKPCTGTLWGGRRYERT